MVLQPSAGSLHLATRQSFSEINYTPHPPVSQLLVANTWPTFRCSPLRLVHGALRLVHGALASGD